MLNSSILALIWSTWINEISTTDADIIGLQEVTENFYNNFLLTKTDYDFCEFRQYTDEDEGLVILSKYPIKSCFFLNTSEEFDYSAALNVIFEADESCFSLTNVHLPWDSIKTQEEQIFHQKTTFRQVITTELLQK